MPYQLDKNNLITAFFNNGNTKTVDRMNAYADNLYLGDCHVFGMAEAQADVMQLLVNTGKYKALKAPGMELACFAHALYVKEIGVVASGGTKRSKYAIFRIEWDGRVGGASEAVVAVFNIHYTGQKRPIARVHEHGQ